MAARFGDWFTNILGVQSVAQFGAQQPSYQHDPATLASADCSTYISALPAGFDSVSVVAIKNNLAVAPEWRGGRVTSPWLNAESTDATLVGCLQIIKAATFVAFHDDFIDYIGAAAKMEVAQLFDGQDATHVHEAPVFIPTIDQFVFADTGVIGWLWALDVKTRETRKILTSPPLHNVNGGTFQNGKLYLTTNGGSTPAVHVCSLPSKSKVSETITCEVVVNNYRLAHLNAPNDLIFTSRGNIMFTDPNYGYDQAWPGVAPPELPTAVYYFNVKTGALTVLTTDTLQPNGLVLSPNEKTFYVADSNSTSGRPIGAWENSVRNVYAYDWDEAKLKLSNQRLVHVVERGWPDGLRLSTSRKGKELVFVASMGGVDVLDVSKGGAGVLIGKFNVGDDVIFNLEPINTAKTVWLLTGKKAVYEVTVAG